MITDLRKEEADEVVKIFEFQRNTDEMINILRLL
jgi:hypothetical protein